MSFTAEFFEQLGRRGHEPLLRRVTASIRFEITEDGHTVRRVVSIDHGDLRLSTDDVPADATLSCSGTELDALVTGRTSAMASLLRGGLAVQGDPELVVLAQRLFSQAPVLRESAPRPPTVEGRSS